MSFHGNINPPPHERDLRDRLNAAVELGQERHRFDDNSLGEPVEPFVLEPGWVSDQQAKAILPLFQAFANGKRVWRWHPATAIREAGWRPLDDAFPVQCDPKLLTLNP